MRYVPGHDCLLPAWDNWWATIIECYPDSFQVAIDCLPLGTDWLQTVHLCEIGARQPHLL